MTFLLLNKDNLLPNILKIKKRRGAGEKVSKPSFPLLWHCFMSAYGKFASVIIS